MKKNYVLEDLDCASCAARLEREISKVEGVQKATVSFFAQRLIIDFGESDADEVMKKVKKVARKALPECRIID